MTTAAPGSSAAVARRGSGLPAGDASSAAARAEAAVPAPVRALILVHAQTVISWGHRNLASAGLQEIGR